MGYLSYQLQGHGHTYAKLALANTHPQFASFSMRAKGQIKYLLSVAEKISILASSGVQIWCTLPAEVLEDQ